MTATPRTLAIGDIHGCLAALDAVLAAVAPGPDDLVVTLGDYVDRGPDSRGVLDRLIALGAQTRLVCLLGNHDEMFLSALDDPASVGNWLEQHAAATLASYGGELSGVPPEHHEFLRRCVPHHETDTHLFVHATYHPDLPLAEQPAFLLRWSSLRDLIPPPHQSGKPAIVGHTAQRTGEVLDEGHIVCIDTYCYGGGWLTAMDVATREVWQFDQHGQPRPPRPETPPEPPRSSRWFGWLGRRPTSSPAPTPIDDAPTA